MSKCQICRKQEAVLRVPECILYNGEGRIIGKQGRLQVCEECFWQWAKENIRKPTQTVLAVA